MTSTNHVMTGAVIAVLVKQPELSVVLAFISHFVLDMFPHFGIFEDDVIRRNKHWLFRTLLCIDIPLMITCVAVVPFLTAPKVAYATVLISMIAAIAPDFIWVYRFVSEVRTKHWEPGGWFVQFHQRIQWFEKPIGLITEVIWLAVMAEILAEII